MRTAICLCGQSREVNETWPSFVKYLLNYMPNPDVFIYTSTSYAVGSDFFATVKPTAYVVEPQFQHWQIEQLLREVGFYADHRIDPTLQQFYGLKKVWELKEGHEKKAGFKYDFVVRTRPDLIYFRPICLEILDLTKINNLHAPFAPTVSTEFAFGPNDEMKKYFGIYDWLAKETNNRTHLGSSDPRLAYPPDHKYNCDVLMASYLLDYMKVDLATQKLPAEAPCPYAHYRIMTRHKKGEYYDLHSPPWKH